MSHRAPGDSPNGQGIDRELACLRCDTQMECRGVGFLTSGSVLNVVDRRISSEAAGQKLDLWTCPNCGHAELFLHDGGKDEPRADRGESLTERIRRNSGRVGDTYSQLGKILRRGRDS